MSRSMVKILKRMRSTEVEVFVLAKMTGDTPGS